MIQTARTHPHELGRAYKHWTLDRLVEYINQELQIGISRPLGKVLEPKACAGIRKRLLHPTTGSQFAEKGGHSSLYQSPPENIQVVCVDEMGPMSAKTYLSRRWCLQGHPPKAEADYGRRAKVWTFGAFEPKTGVAFTCCIERRRSCDFVAFLGSCSDLARR
jgi:hypothetical protein